MKRLQFTPGVWLALALLCGAGLPARAVTITVTNINDSGAGSLRQAILDSAGNGIINFHPLLNGQTIVLTSGELGIGRNLTITGPGATNLTISGNDSSRVFNISGATVSLSGLTIAHGHNAGTNGTALTFFCSGDSPYEILPTAGGSGMGGAILNSGNLTLSNCVLSGNTAVGGTGGSGTRITTDCSGWNTPDLSSDGKAGGDAKGGAIFNSGTMALLGCTFSSNSVSGGDGGEGGLGSAMSVYFGKDGGAAGSGAGGACYNNGILTAVNCTLAANSATGGSGGNGGNGADIPTHESRHGGNGAQGGNGSGGAIASSSSNTMNSCTVSGNSVAWGSGGARGTGVNGGANGTAGADGTALGGGVHASTSVWSIGNTIIALNTGTAPDVSGAVTSVGFNLIGKTNGSSGWIAADLPTVGSIAFPLGPNLGALQYNNGGPTPTMLPSAISAAIDNGNSFGTTTDQRGFTRPVNLPDGTYPNAVGGDGSDIGACEVQSLSPAGLDIGLRLFDGTANITIACETPAVSPLRIAKGGTTYGIILVPTSSPDASKFRIQTASGTKSLMKLP